MRARRRARAARARAGSRGGGVGARGATWVWRCLGGGRSGPVRSGQVRSGPVGCSRIRGRALAVRSCTAHTRGAPSLRAPCRLGPSTRRPRAMRERGELWSCASRFNRFSRSNRHAFRGPRVHACATPARARAAHGRERRHSSRGRNTVVTRHAAVRAQGVFAAHKSRAPALPVEYVQCGGKEATLLDCKQHAFNAKSKAVCDADASQGLECVGGDGAPQARSCSAAPQLLRAQPAHAHPEASGVRAPTLASVGVFALVALVALAAGGARPWRAERTGLPVHVGAGQPATFQMI